MLTVIAALLALIAACSCSRTELRSARARTVLRADASYNRAAARGAAGRSGYPPMSNLTVFVVLYLLASIAIGLVAARRVHNSRDYVVAGRASSAAP